MTPNFPLHDAAYNYAKHCINVHEDPMGSNHGPIEITHPPGGVDFFQEHDFVAGGGYAWCVDLWLTSWAVGAKHPFPYLSPGAYAIGDWAKAHGLTRPITLLVPGDGCVWNEGAGHLSMFESYNSATGIVTTIDGNWGDKVQRVEHNVRNLRVGIHVPEDPSFPHISAPRPFFTIATSVNGHKKILFTNFATKKKILGMLPRLLVKYGKNGITIKRSMKRKK